MSLTSTDSAPTSAVLPTSVSSPTLPPLSLARTRDGAQELELAELLKFKMRYGRPHVLVRWTVPVRRLGRHVGAAGEPD